MSAIEETVESIYHLLPILHLIRRLKDLENASVSDMTKRCLLYGCYDDTYQIYLDLIQDVCDHFESDYDCDEDCEDMYFSDAAIRDYYRLCREHSRLTGMDFEQNPYVLKAEQTVRYWLHEDGCYYCGYELSLDHESEFGYGVHFLCDNSYFCEYDALIERVANLIAEFRDLIPELRQKVELLKRRVALVPVPKQTALMVLPTGKESKHGHI